MKSKKASDDHTNNIHSDLLAARELVYDKCGYEYTPPLMEAESAEYGACTFELNGLSVLFRVAKITPTKTGQFVTIWKRHQNGPIEPYDMSDPVDLFIISTRNGNHFGQFIFPIAVLCEHDIVANNNKGGKRAIRVYPPWDKTMNRQAQKTQQWQLDFFLEIPDDKPTDLVRLKKLYCQEG
ncbi:MepB family protein [Chitinophaga niastensis]|nr:MepB family protein [Chitinophaga niastensis]